MTRVGIDAMSYYVPPIFLSLEELAKQRGIEYPKLNKGLGLYRMALCDVDEDTATMTAEAAYRLITQNNIDPREIGRMYLGTESALDAAKPTATYAMSILEQRLTEKYGARSMKNCDVLDMTFACVGGVDAVHNCLDWVKAGENRKAIVIAADYAKYDLDSTGEYTQGAGAVAMLLSESPRMFAVEEKFGVATESVGDFYKPRRTYDKIKAFQEAAALLGNNISEKDALELINSSSDGFWNFPERKMEIHRDAPVFDGPYSNDCYQARIEEALAHLRGQKDINIIEDWSYLIFHLPYAFQGRRMITPMWIDWMIENDRLEELEAIAGIAYNKEDAEAYKNFLRAVSKSDLYRSFVNDRIAKGEIASSHIGNMYTASIFMSLLSMMRAEFEADKDIVGKTIGCFSYGSGSKSKVFELEIQENWKDVISGLDIFTELDNRSEIDFATYEKLHRKELTAPILGNKNIALNNVGEEGTVEGLRYY